MDKQTQISKKLNELKSNIEEIKQSYELDTNFHICAATKYANTDEIEILYNNGIRIFGENRVNDGIQKIKQLKHLNNIEWHFIGRIQSNKINKIIENYDVVQSIDSEDKLIKINEAAKENK